MIGYSALREIIGSYALASVARTDLTFPFGSFLCIRFRTVKLIKTAFQHLHCLFLILTLAALILTLNDNARRNMGYSYRAGGLIDMLAACAACSVCVYAYVVRVDFDINAFRFRKHRDCRRAGLYPSLRLGLGYTLHTVHSAFILHARIRAPAVQAEYGFLHAAHLGFIAVDKLKFKVMTLRIPLIHAKKHRTEKRGFLSAGACAYLHDDAALIVFILWEEHDFELINQSFRLFAEFAKLLLGKLLHIPIATCVGKHLPAFIHRSCGSKVFIVFGYDWFKRRMLLDKLTPFRLIRNNSGIGELRCDFIKMLFHLLKSCKHK